MNLTDTPDEFKEAFSQSVANLDKLQDARNIGHHRQADIQNLFNSTQIRQNQLLEDILLVLPSMQIQVGQEGPTNGALTRLASRWDQNVNLSRNIMQIIDISNKKERGELSYDMTIDLINPPKVELTGATSVVPENIVRNINAFTGTKTENDDLDIILEGFLKSIYEAGQTQKLSHSAQKELIIRKLSPNCILLINSYLDTSNKTIEDTTLHQLVGILEQIFMPNSQPSEALVKLQKLGKIKNNDYLNHCAIISRLVRLSVRKEQNADSKKTLQESRSAEYMKSSLSDQDSHLIRAQEIRRAEEQKQPLTALKIAKFLTQYHNNKKDPHHDFDLSTVNRVEEDESFDTALVVRGADKSRPFVRPSGQRSFQQNRARYGNFRGRGTGNFQNSSNRGFGNFRGRGNNFSRPNTFQRSAYRGQRPPQYGNNNNNFNQNNNNVRGGWKQNGFRPNYNNQPRGRGFQTNRPYQREDTMPLVIADARVGKQECIMCGNLHSYKSHDCCYNGMQPTRRTHPDKPASVCPIHKKFLHTAQQCLGDVKINMSRLVEIDDDYDDFDAISKN